MTKLWNLLTEITVQPEDFPSGDTAGYMNIITWAESAETAKEKIEIYFERFSWKVVEVDEAKVLALDFVCDSEEFQAMFDSALNNPEAIICGTFHSYRVN